MTFLNHIKKFKNKVAIVDNFKIFSYNELIGKSIDFCENIKNKSLIFLLAENDIETIFFYLGLLKNKSVIVILNSNLRKLPLYNLITRYKPNYIITSRKDLNFDKYNFLYKKNSYEIYKKKIYIKHNFIKDLALLMSTSGTTGSPKLVRLSCENYKDNTKKIIKSLNIKSSDSVITTLPFSYTYGLSIINSYLFIGAKIYLNKYSIVKKDFWDIYKKYQPTSFYGVPFTYELLNRLDYKNFSTKKLRFFANAGGKLDDNLLSHNIKFSKNNNLKFFQMYGQTEASPRISVLNPKYNLSKFNSIGKPLQGGKFKLVDKNKNYIKKPFVSGELTYFGKNVSLGYAFNYKDLNKRNSNNYKLFTGDIAYFDKQNFFYIIGRKTNFIKIFGLRIDLDYLENFLLMKGFDLKCENKDNEILLCYRNKNIDKKLVINILSKEFNINKKYINFKYLKNLKYNQNKIL